MINETETNLELLKALTSTMLLEIDSLHENGHATIEDEEFNYFDAVRDFEVKLIKTALIKTGGNQRQAASLLGIATSTLNHKIKTLKIRYLRVYE